MALTDSLTGYYKLESDGTDSVGTVGTASGTAPTYTTGKIDNCGSFASASSQYLETATYSGGTSWTVNFWINQTTATNAQPLCQDLVSGSQRLWGVSIGNSGANMQLFGWNSSGTLYFTTSTAHGMSTGTWYMWTARWDAGTNTMSLYKNGASFTSVSTSGNARTTATKFSIGRQGDASGYFNGKIDEVGYWTRAISDSEITSLYNSGSGLGYPFSTTSIKTVNGLAYASVKTVNGLAVASVKTINGLA